MKGLLSRRSLLSQSLAGGLVASTHRVWAQAANPDQGLLARLRAAKKVHVGVANAPPFSVLNPDGTLNGIAPVLARTIMERLGVPEMTGSAAAYGDLIPGMQAGRWDFVAAALVITKVRCDQILFSDPILYDVSCFATLKGEFPNPPKRVREVIDRKLKVGAATGGARARLSIEMGIAPENLFPFPNELAAMDGLFAKRVQVIFSSFSNLNSVVKRRNLDVEMIYPVEDDPAHGSACAFRLGDSDLHAAFQKELANIIASGEYPKLADPFGFSIPDVMKSVSAAQLCREAT